MTILNMPMPPVVAICTLLGMALAILVRTPVTASTGHEDQALDEDGRHGRLPLDLARAPEADHVVRKVGIQAHARREREGQVGAEAHAQAYGLIEADA